ncbi:MAG: hypothetical protein ABIO44_00940 [Saprospiraceae bacterium]
MNKIKYDIGLIYEHPNWHQPLFDELARSEVSFEKIDLKQGSFSFNDKPASRLYYNLVSPSAYNRGNQRAIPFAYSLCVYLESKNSLVLNGSKSMKLELSKSSQMNLLQTIGIDFPKSYVFNSVEALKKYINEIKFPQILKPEQGGSGSRMYKVNSMDEIEEIFNANPDLWFPDNLFLLQELIDYDNAFGIVRVEFIGDELLYAMRVVTNGTFNLCPSVLCNPENDEAGICEILLTRPPEFFSYKEIPKEAINEAKVIAKASGHHIVSVEYAESLDGRRIFYDINSNSNLRESISLDYSGVNPFSKVVDYLKMQLVKSYGKD